MHYIQRYYSPFFDSYFIDLYVIEVWSRPTNLFQPFNQPLSRERELGGAGALSDWDSLSQQCDRLINTASGLTSHARVSYPRSVALACNLGMVRLFSLSWFLDNLLDVIIDCQDVLIFYSYYYYQSTRTLSHTL